MSPLSDRRGRDIRVEENDTEDSNGDRWRGTTGKGNRQRARRIELLGRGNRARGHRSGSSNGDRIGSHREDVVNVCTLGDVHSGWRTSGGDWQNHPRGDTEGKSPGRKESSDRQAGRRRHVHDFRLDLPQRATNLDLERRVAGAEEPNLTV